MPRAKRKAGPLKKPEMGSLISNEVTHVGHSHFVGIFERIGEGCPGRQRAVVYGQSAKDVLPLARAITHLPDLVNALHWAEVLLASIRGGSSVTADEVGTIHRELRRLTELVPEF